MNMNDIKDTIRRVLKDLDCVDNVKFIKCSGDTIRRYVDMDYTGEDKEILHIEYDPECYAMPRDILYWEYIRPDELRNEVEI